MSIETFNQLKRIVAPVLKHYQDDLYKYDYNTLKKSDTPFIYGYRRTGTDLLRMLPGLRDYSFKHANTVEEKQKLLEEDIIWIDYPNRNTHFLHYDGRKLRKKTAAEIRKIWFDHVRMIVRNEKNHFVKID